MSYTPGPWKVGYSDGSGAEDIPREGAEITDESDKAIVRGGSPEGDIAYGVLWVEDARLMAAAPELLEALKESASLIAVIADVVCEEDRDSIDELLPRLNAAIAKAEGRAA